MPQSLTLPSKLIHHFSDGVLLYCLIDNKKFYSLMGFDNNLEKVSNFNFNYFPGDICPLVDANFIYLPSKDNRLILIDKFSGEMISNIYFETLEMIGNPILKDFVYCLCKMHTNKINKIDNWSIVKYSKQSGKKKNQSKTFHGTKQSFSIGENLFYLNDKYLYKINKDTCEVLNETQIKINSTYDIFSNDNKVWVSSSSGVAEVFDNDLNIQFKVITKPNHLSPSIVGENVVWPCNNEIFHIDIQNKKVKMKHAFENNIIKCYSINDFVYFCDSINNIFKSNSNIDNIIPVGNYVADTIVSIEKEIAIVLGNQIIKI